MVQARPDGPALPHPGDTRSSAGPPIPRSVRSSSPLIRRTGRASSRRDFVDVDELRARLQHLSAQLEQLSFREQRMAVGAISAQLASLGDGSGVSMLTEASMVLSHVAAESIFEVQTDVALAHELVVRYMETL